MNRINQFHKLFISVAIEVSKMSRCDNAKVGAVIVENNNIVSFGYNGTPCGYCNDCEDSYGVTKKEVLHAESNAILKAKKDLSGCKLYTTMSPCLDCCKLIKQSGIDHVYYISEYKDMTGLNIFKINNTKI